MNDSGAATSNGHGFRNALITLIVAVLATVVAAYLLQDQDTIFRPKVDLVERALNHYRVGNYDQALSDLNEVIISEPDNPQYYRFRSTIYLEKREFHEALADVNRAISLAPQEAEFYNWRAAISYNIEAQKIQNDEEADFSSIIANHNQAIELDPTVADYYNDRAFTFYIIGLAGDDYTNNMIRAVDDYTRAIHLDPNMGVYYYYRGQAHQNLGNDELAERDIARARELGYTASR